MALITGESSISQRIAVLNKKLYRYRDGKERLLVTTNSCAWGIDVEQVTVVVNYDIPVDVHRQPDFVIIISASHRPDRQVWQMWVGH